MTLILITLVKILSHTTRLLRLGNGSTWPGHIALKLSPTIIQDIIKASSSRIIVVTGTNGKTTTSRMIAHILKTQSLTVFHNESGANLLNGIASSLILNASLKGKVHKDVAVFEVDENALAPILKVLQPDMLIFLNLFRDQLDRYGEVRAIAHKWQKAISELSKKTTLILNEDDPEIAYLAKFAHGNVKRFGLDSKKHVYDDSTSDSTSCPRCGEKLTYQTRVYSHIGKWHCKKCKLTHSKTEISHLTRYPLIGTYNKYNTHAAVLSAMLCGVSKNDAITSLSDFTPAFGRQESIQYKNRMVTLFLSKNPAGFNQSLETVMERKPKAILFILNDRVPDGRDVSWIWDTDIERFSYVHTNVFTSGDRVYDMALRLKYANIPVDTIPDLTKAVLRAVTSIPKNETLYILPTYSAMLETRKIVTGKKIL